MEAIRIDLDAEGCDARRMVVENLDGGEVGEVIEVHFWGEGFVVFAVEGSGHIVLEAEDVATVEDTRGVWLMKVVCEVGEEPGFGGSGALRDEFLEVRV